MMENAHVFGSVVVVAGFNAERHVVAFVEAEHKILAAWSSAGAAHRSLPQKPLISLAVQAGALTR
jgi:hypothetical protein